MPPVQSGAQRRRSAPLTPRARKLIAGAVLILVAAAEYRLSTLPIGAKLPEQIIAKTGEDIILADVATAGRVLAYQGPAGDGVDIRFDRARLSAESLGLLRSLGENVSDAEGPISWITRHETASRTAIHIRMANAGSTLPKLRLRGLQAAGTATSLLEIETPEAPLQVEMDVPLVNEDRSVISKKTLRVGDREIKLDGAFPLTVIVARNASFRMQFANARGDAKPAFTLGGTPSKAGEEDGLMLQSVGIQKSALPAVPYSYFACAASAGTVAWAGSAKMIGGRCDTAQRLITVRRLELTGSDLALALSGTGWAQREGEPVGTNLLSRISHNLVLAGSLLVLNLVLVGWLLMEVFGRKPAPKWSGGIFISYRRAESLQRSGRLDDHLSAHFGQDRVFIDYRAIGLGEDFARKIQQSLMVTDVLLAIIGKQWLDVKDDAGHRRIDNPDDLVRKEISTAIEREAWVIPVLVDGATMPHERDLPSALASLARRNAFDISDARFKADVNVLIAALEKGRTEHDAEPADTSLRSATTGS